MRKTRTKQTTETVHCCDLCERDINNGFYDRCSICGRDACFSCRKLMFLVKSGDWPELALHVCTDCQQHAEIFARIMEAIRVANEVVGAALKEWKEAVRNAS